MAVADADYRFIYADIGGYGSESDASVFRDSDFGKRLFTRKLHLPKSHIMYGKETPYVFVADDAFPLHKHILKPYKPTRKGAPLRHDEAIFNKRFHN
jgi:DDE superfamily endonuclease